MGNIRCHNTDISCLHGNITVEDIIDTASALDEDHFKKVMIRHIYDEGNTFSCLGSLPQITFEHFVLSIFSGGFYEPNRRRIFIT